MGTVTKIFEGLHFIERPPVPPELRGMPPDILSHMEETIARGSENVANTVSADQVSQVAYNTEATGNYSQEAI